MRVAIIGRSELMYNTAVLFHQQGYEIPLIVTCKEAPEYKKTSQDFEKFAKEIGAEYLYTPNVNLGKHIEAIRSAGLIDIAVSINYSGVISQEVIDIFPHGILNAHAGDLPKYRGNAPLAWAIINKEKRAVLCIHKMIGGELDSGNILARASYDINEDTRVGQLFEWIENEIPSLMLESARKIEADKQFTGEAQPTDPSLALRCYPRMPEDGKIQWSNANDDVLRLINASSEPFAGAFAVFKGETFRIWRACLVSDGEIFSAIPGQVCKVHSTGELDVATGKGKIRIQEAEYDGLRAVPATFIKSIRSRLY